MARASKDQQDKKEQDRMMTGLITGLGQLV
jgi:hypothetical protein